MKRHLLKPISIFVFGMIIFSSCGNDTKSKPISNSNKETKVVNVENTSPEKRVDTSSITSLLAEANDQKKNVEEVNEVVEEQSFNPPHIPVFKKEKTKAKNEEEKNLPKKEAKRNVASQKTENQKATASSSASPVVKTKTKESITQGQSAKGKSTEIVWRRNFYSFGDIMQGDTVYFKFEFTNIGEHPLEIESATASCGCTHPSFSFIPVESNNKGEIKGMYISDDTKKGTENAMILVKANTDPPLHKLYIDGNVILPDGNSKDTEGESKGN